MDVFYFTFGSLEQFPYQGGWVEVWALTLHEAIEKFKAKHPNVRENILNCSDYYTEEQFKVSEMWKSGNRGKWCHDVII